MKTKLCTLALIFCIQIINAQESLSSIVKENAKTFSIQNNQFVGDGWNQVLGQIKTHNNILIGEDHFFNEVPFFVSKISSEVKFDNFFCEIDPYSAKIIEKKIKTLSHQKLEQYTKKFSNTFSFYALDPEFKLLKKFALSKTNIIGTDQIVLNADRLIFSELKKETKNKKAFNIYSFIEKQSTVHFNQFTKGNGSPYIFADNFNKNLNLLKSLKLSSKEQKIIRDIQLSQQIYQTQNHKLRIQLMKHNLMNNFRVFSNSKNLFKYGAIHMPKGESLLKNYDLGNLISNIAESQFQSSLHIMIIGESGVQGVPFKGMKPQALDVESKDLKHYKIFFDAMDKNEWYVFNTEEILKKAQSKKIKVDNKTLERVLKGYDFLIVIPEVTPSKFMN